MTPAATSPRTLTNLRSVALAVALLGVFAKVGLFLGNFTTVSTLYLVFTWISVVLGVAAIVGSVVALVSRGPDWMPYMAFILGLIAFVPVVGVAA
jgi:hypothetical protein